MPSPVQENLDIADGWHRFIVRDSDCTIVFILRDPLKPAFFEVTAQTSTPGYAKLSAGRYGLTLQSNRISPDFSVQKLSRLSLIRFFSTEFIKRLKHGAPPRTLLRHITRALTHKGGQGGIASVTPLENPGELKPGPLALAQLTEVNRSLPITNLQGPRIFISVLSPGSALQTSLMRQTYARFTMDPDEKATCDFVLSLPGTAQLMPDCLEALIAPTINHPDRLVIFADVFINRLPTFNFSYDPVRHTHVDTLSDLVLVSRRLYDLGGALAGITTLQVHKVKRPLAIFSAPVAKPQIPLTPDFGTPPPVSCIIPTRDHANLLRNIVYDLLRHSDGIGEIIIIDNGSVERETHDLLIELVAYNIRVVRDEGDFNFSRLCNSGAAVATGSVLAFINNDIRVQRRDWLKNLAGWAIQPHVGAVGTRLLYEDDTLQHAGICLALSGFAGHLFRGWPKEKWDLIPTITEAGIRSAVTGAVLVVEAAKFSAVNGFNEVDFPVTLNDADLCLRLAAGGLVCIYEPRGAAYHLEGRSRGTDLAPQKQARRDAEIRIFMTRWQKEIETEPWFSTALSRVHEPGKIL